MQIEVKGRNTPVTDELREHVEKRFTKVGKQVSEFARLEIEVYEERNPAIADNQVAEATLALKGVTLRAQDRARDLRHAINLCEEELSRQVKRHREKRRGRRKVGTETHSDRDRARGLRRRDGDRDVTGSRTASGGRSAGPQSVAGGSCRRTRPQTPQAPSEGRVRRHPPEHRLCPAGRQRSRRGPPSVYSFAAAAPAPSWCAVPSAGVSRDRGLPPRWRANGAPVLRPIVAAARDPVKWRSAGCQLAVRLDLSQDAAFTIDRAVHPRSLIAQQEVADSPADAIERHQRTRWLANAEADHGRATRRRRAEAHRLGAGAAAAKE